ncbi:MAG: MMPL family transporter, partial [Mariprofundus sp.]|nr:MMPL family transporter [Mariprofundus sp.]
DLTEKIRLLPGVVDQEVVSLSTEDNIHGTADGMEVEPFMDAIPSDAATLRSLQQQIHDFDMYDGFIVAKDGSAAAIVVKLESAALLARRGLDKFNVYESVQQTVNELTAGRDEQFYVAGKPVLEATLGMYIAKDLGLMMPLVFLTLAILLFFTYRSLRGIVIPLAVVSFSVLGAMGIMAFSGVPMYPTTTMVPVTLMAIGVADAIHLLGKYYELALLNPERNRRSIVLATMQEMWRPVVLTSVTTAIGFLSFLSMGMVPLQMMGLFAAVGIIYAMLVSLTLVPAMLMLMKVAAPRLLKVHASDENGFETAGFVSTQLARLGTWVGEHVTLTLFLTSGLIFFSAWAASSVYVDDAYVANFKKGSPIVKADKVINKHFIGSYQFNVLLEGEKSETFYRPEALKAVWGFQKEMEARNSIVGGSISIADYIRRMNRVMNENRPEMARIPDSSNLIAQYLLLYSFSGAPDDFAEVVDSEYRMANIRLFLTEGQYSYYHKIQYDLHALAAKYFDPLHIKWSIAGNGNISYVQTKMITDNLRLNIIATVLSIFLAAWLMMRSFAAGVFVMTPVLAAVIFNFAFMGLTDTHIGWGASMFTSVAICIGVDYAIHLIYKFRSEFGRGVSGQAVADHPLPAQTDTGIAALTRTLATTGKTILFNAVVVIAGFMVLLASVMPPNQQMGLLVSAAMLSSFIATLTVLPALILAARPRFVFGEREAKA